MGTRLHLLASAAAILASSQALGSFTVYNETSADWFGAVATRSEITFAELPANTQVINQYAGLGVHFTDAEGDSIWPNTNPPAFPQDGWGLRGFQVVELTFDVPMSAFAAFHPSFDQFKFYSGTTLLYQSAALGGGGGGHFTGFTTDTPFDRIVVTGYPLPPPFDPGPVDFDSIYFSAVPGPGAALLFAIGAAVRPRLRRR